MTAYAELSLHQQIVFRFRLRLRAGSFSPNSRSHRPSARGLEYERKGVTVRSPRPLVAHFCRQEDMNYKCRSITLQAGVSNRYRVHQGALRNLAIFWEIKLN